MAASRTQRRLEIRRQRRRALTRAIVTAPTRPRNLWIASAILAAVVALTPMPDDAVAYENLEVRTAGLMSVNLPGDPVSPAVEITRSRAVERSVNDAGAQVELSASKAERTARRPVARARIVPTGSVWDRLAQCEASGNWSHSTGRFHGGLQFHPDTWRRYRLPGYPAYAYEASREQQIEVAKRVLASQGWGAWPSCSRRLGLRG